MNLFVLLAVAWAGDDKAQWLPTTTLLLGSVVVEAEVADDPSERELGLMYRESMPDDRGMLFVYPSARPRSFWMRNTPLPLSIAFIDAKGVVVSVSDMEPFSTSPVPSGKPAMYALEVNQGWFATHAVAVGTPVTGLPGPCPE